jgi:hypothetical protein
MVTIQHLEVLLEVDGSEEEVAFGRLFDKYIRRWDRAQEEERARARLIDRERRIQDPGGVYA